MTAQLDNAVGLVSELRDEAKAEADKIKASLVPPRDVAGELRAQRNWARQEKLLDAAKNQAQRVAIAQQLIKETSDPAHSPP
ncbi:hypothetical protein [Mycobacterium sp.]|uniref:hypothetical protein n=1 Tax=Mycobacterium sp. TaxID=1785 RepID=UPI003F9D3D9E